MVLWLPTNRSTRLINTQFIAVSVDMPWLPQGYAGVAYEHVSGLYIRTANEIVRAGKLTRIHQYGRIGQTPAGEVPRRGKFIPAFSPLRPLKMRQEYTKAFF